ncbi:MAG: hypothetical protein ACRC56_00625 [Bosea sp. (in: a-proteobacteria)]
MMPAGAGRVSEDEVESAQDLQPGHRVIVPGWGRMHITRFVEWILPSWLAERNLPALAARGPLTVTILTTGDGRAQLNGDRHFVRLAKMAQVEFLAIDDLIAGSIGSVTLTLAYARGMISSPFAQEGQRTIFLNADFMLGNGSLAAIAERFDSGSRLLLSPSLRVTEERVLQQLENYRQSDGSLNIENRDAVALALGALHPTLLACRADQTIVRSAHPNQFFWRIDETCMIGRAFCLFPLAVVPEHLPKQATGYCDYGWLSQLAPKAAVDVMSDSDDFIAIELSPRIQESQFVELGGVTPSDAARQLSVWLTAFNQAQSSHNLVFHSGPIPEALPISDNVATRFVTEIASQLQPVRAFAGHPYWTGGVDAWRKRREEAGVETDVPELEPTGRNSEHVGPVSLRPWFRLSGRRILVGAAGERAIWHPYWRAERILRGLGLPTPRDNSAREFLASILGQSDGIASTDSQLAIVAVGRDDPFLNILSLIENNPIPDSLTYLVVNSPIQGQELELRPQDLAAILVEVDNHFTIDAATVLTSAEDERALAAHRALGQGLHMSGRYERFRLFSNSIFAIARLFTSNLVWLARSAIGGTPRPPDWTSSRMVMLELRERKSGS